MSKVLDKVVKVCRDKGMRRSTIKAYRNWSKRFFIWHRQVSGHWVYPKEMGDQNDPETGKPGRYHVNESALQRSIKQAASKAGITKRVTSKVFRHSFATHLLENGESIYTIKDLLGHDKIETTAIYLHCVTPAVLRVTSPLDVSEDQHRRSA